MTTYMEIGILLVHIESMAITLFCFKVNRQGKLRIQMLLKVPGDPLNKRFPIISQFDTLALIG